MTSLQDLISMFNTARRNKYDEDLNKDQTYVTERPSYFDIHNQRFSKLWALFDIKCLDSDCSPRRLSLPQMRL